ncbi:MAG: hypothetical protein HOM18_03010 [Candidatus Marinimicrobia bacterium]|jgi:hypothetical protein|nr:hypothetical protein [Candidatus Neomarinimicrobiota bacterium]
MTQILYMVLKETILSLLGRVMWKAIAERMATRLVVYGLKKLEGYSTNEVTSGLVKDILASLEGKGLKAL